MEILRSKIILGTVQMGIPYGINNTLGKISEEEAFIILDTAHRNSVAFLDTADAYGTAMDVIGNYHRKRKNKFNIITKFHINEAGANLKLQLEKTLQKLQVDSVFCYQYHRFSDSKIPEVAHELRALKEQQLIKYVGASVYTEQEIQDATASDLIDVIQIPFNLLDNFNLKGSLLAEAKRKGKIIHTRSVFLQGLFFKPAVEFSTYLKPLVPYIERAKEIASKHAIDLNEMALLYAAQQKEIDAVLIGVDSLEHLTKNLNAFDKKISDKVIAEINTIKVAEPLLLNPSTWK